VAEDRRDDREPDPDAALAQLRYRTAAGTAFPSWFLRITCDRCYRDNCASSLSEADRSVTESRSGPSCGADKTANWSGNGFRTHSPHNVLMRRTETALLTATPLCLVRAIGTVAAAERRNQ